MSSLVRVLALTSVALGAKVPAQATTPLASLQVVPFVDFNRYAGTWHEVARLPNRFEGQCLGDTTATYALRTDGRLSVTNRCRTASGKFKTVSGTARIRSANGPNTKLKVSFFWPFWGDYWIIDLDPEYAWVAVGEPRRRYFWILGRQPQLSDQVYEQIVSRAERQGYNLSALMRVVPRARGSS